MNFLKKMAGNEYVGFSNATYVELKSFVDLFIDTIGKE